MNACRTRDVPLGETKYHHLELSLQQRLLGGHEFTVAYTRAWHSDATSSTTSSTSCRLAPEQLVASASLHDDGIVELPFGDGKPWLRPRAPARAAGGWQVSGIYHLQSGRPSTGAIASTTATATRTSSASGRTRSRALVQHRRLRARGARQPAAFHRACFRTGSISCAATT